ncbi:MAG TPA: hypothetical protein QF517_06780 [Pseudomonadales bacterium]|nr:hypothetical protein [Pseudomonadales bacterium]MDP6317265.1 hypothetical protein [Pseudomonadales bacterium]MDP7315223.1 hypothetical protein [Pseudomonadales bacterium]MDP7576555.1 hypothetical protein [Pseudomonadales bacterium]HJL61647.1 hypothetical protein [Pseudomonadales bacterium]
MDPRLVVYLDFSGISGFLALQPTYDLLDEVDVSVRWLPITGILNRMSNKAPSEPSNDPLAAYKARRKKARDQFAEAELKRNSQLLGITPLQASRTFDAGNAHIGLLYLNQLGIDPRDYIALIYRAAFVDEKPVEDLQNICGYLDQLGIESTGLGAYEETGREVFEKLQEELLEQGIFDSPAFLYQGERFFGRQHIPLLSWYIRGSEGTPPV